MVVGRLVAGLVVGLALGAGYWAAAITLQGHSIAEAVHGQVEDALGLLEGLIALGGLCGAGVGLGSGVVALGKSCVDPGAAAEPPRE
jgi:hypothetical protein